MTDQEQPAGQWERIASAPRDGTNILLRFGSDGVSQGKYVPGLPHPWLFIDTNDGITWLINRAVDGPGGPSHWQPMPPVALAASPAPTPGASVLSRVEQLIDAIEGECDGLAITPRQAVAILEHVDAAPTPADAAPPEPILSMKREEREALSPGAIGALTKAVREAQLGGPGSAGAKQADEVARKLWRRQLDEFNAQERAKAEPPLSMSMFASAADYEAAMAQQTEQGEREAFEAWARANTTLSLQRDPDDPESYYRASAEGPWLAWQARAARSPKGQNQ